MMGVTLLTSVAAGAAGDIPLGNVPISINLTNLPKITVEKPGGGWYDTLALSNSAGSDIARYQVQAPVQVSIRNERHFMVSLVEPLVLTHETNATLAFTTEQVAFGYQGGALQALGSTPVDFSNPALIGGTSTGSYVLSIAARQPAGGTGAIAGNYIGKLVLLFEVKI
ncbi:hypothetical protein Z042_01855 [Chania multitudinisentens RB-25]|uniref:Fimbrial protein n=2 Tax=Chania TaxID=1745211 RepID=W0LKR4_9GAMM|nr:hypothetical protein Z042_01855 [Chania multitudinisentens RB-25]